MGIVFTSQHNYSLAGVFHDDEQRPKTRQDANDLLAPGSSSHDAFAAITTLLYSTGGVRFPCTSTKYDKSDPTKAARRVKTRLEERRCWQTLTGTRSLGNNK